MIAARAETTLATMMVWLSVGLLFSQEPVLLFKLFAVAVALYAVAVVAPGTTDRTRDVSVAVVETIIQCYTKINVVIVFRNHLSSK